MPAEWLGGSAVTRRSVRADGKFHSRSRLPTANVRWAKDVGFGTPVVPDECDTRTRSVSRLAYGRQEEATEFVASASAPSTVADGRRPRPALIAVNNAASATRSSLSVRSK